MATYGDRYGAGPAFKPGSVTLALATTALPVLALAMGLQISGVALTPTILNTYTVPPDQPPPPPDRIPPKTKALPNEQIYVPPVPDLPPIPQTPTDVTPDLPPLPPMGTEIGKTPEIGTVITPVVVAKPVIVDAFVESRYQSLLQPPYPPEEQRAGNSGRVVLRVLVGTDGRVKQVEKVSAASDAFFAAAQRQALGKWRFKPATKDGAPIEQWKTMSLRFVLNEQ
ncbi:MAG: TonB family protein [Sphingomonas sp.]|nr:TonB family protein [Sphingomonas sp.]